jgi:YegS/Rv2252/BmrU family lipid kinase
VEPPPIAVIINSSAGDSRSAETGRRLKEILQSKGSKWQISLARNGEEISALAHQQAERGNGIVVAAGGDGTINTVASALVGTGKPLGVLPLGTLNHFAKDLKIPLDLEAAVETILEGHAISIDVGEVNGRFFLNNSSLGIYPRMVEEREQRQQQGRSKWIASLAAAYNMLHRYPVLSVRLKTNNQELARRTPIVFVGNNEYELQGLKIGTRQCLDRGLLHLYVMRHTGTWGLIRLFFSALMGELDSVKEFDTLCVREVRVEARRQRLRVALDGEVTVMETPLYYRTRPAALRVVVPKDLQQHGE